LIVFVGKVHCQAVAARPGCRWRLRLPSTCQLANNTDIQEGRPTGQPCKAAIPEQVTLLCLPLQCYQSHPAVLQREWPH
jgi:hypothetical protein